MDKKQSKLIPVLALLLAVTAIVVSTNSKSTINDKQGTFAVSDTSAVTLVIISDTHGNNVKIVRHSNQWFADQALARTDLMTVLMKVLHDIEKSKVVANSDIGNIVNIMKEDGFTVTVMGQRKKIVSYTICFDGDLCYALKEGADKPYVVEVPGYGQMITILKLANPVDWKSRSVFAVQPKDIAQIVFNDETDNSFIIKKSGKEFEVFSYPVGLKIQGASIEKVAGYVEQFRKKDFSAYVQLQQTAIDSITSTRPIYTLSVTTTDGREMWCKAFERHLPWQGNQLDPDNFYLLLVNGDFVQAKYFDFDPLVKSVNSFRN